jgi:hypothetical protein
LAQRAEGFIDKSINIPYEDLRDNHQNLDKKTKKINQKITENGTFFSMSIEIFKRKLT